MKFRQYITQLRRCQTGTLKSIHLVNYQVLIPFVLCEDEQHSLGQSVAFISATIGFGSECPDRLNVLTTGVLFIGNRGSLWIEGGSEGVGTG